MSHFCNHIWRVNNHFSEIRSLMKLLCRERDTLKYFPFFLPNKDSIIPVYWGFFYTIDIFIKHTYSLFLKIEWPAHQVFRYLDHHENNNCLFGLHIALLHNFGPTNHEAGSQRMSFGKRKSVGCSFVRQKRWGMPSNVCE